MLNYGKMKNQNKNQKFCNGIFKFPLVKQGQMKIQQMAFMMVAIFIFFALVGMLIITTKFSGLKEQANLLHEENAMRLASKIANSPEFSCGNSFETSEASCVDFDKVMALKEQIKNNPNIYKDFWGDVSKIEIIKIYPSEENITKCTNKNYPNCSKLTLISGQGMSKGNFITLCRKEFKNAQTYDKCELAQIFVNYEVVE